MTAEAPLAAGFSVEPFGKGLGKSVGNGLGHNRGVVVEVALVVMADRLAAMASRDGKCAKVVLATTLQRGHKICQRVERVLPLSLPLLP